MEQVKKKGNPNFGVKKPQDEVLDDYNKSYTFVLIDTYEKYKPTDGETGQRASNPYPPIYKLPSDGRTLDDATGKNRMWRCIKGEDSIWTDEQGDFEVTSYEDYEDLIFNDGRLIVKGFEKNKLAALLNQDTYLDKKYKKANVRPVYRLIDEDKDLDNALNRLDVFKKGRANPPLVYY